MKRWAASIFALSLFCAILACDRPVVAIDLFNKCTDASCAVVKENRLKPDNSNVVLDVMRVVLMALGSISVLMIVIGGMRFVLSGGDAAGVSTAKKTVLYAVIGLVVALMAGGVIQMITGYFL